MNTKKHKNKNRAKPPKITVETKNEDILENVSVVEQKDSAPSDICNKEDVTESIDNKIEVKETVQEQTTTCEVPKKPKRKKGKKKPDEWIEEKEIVLGSSDKLNEKKDNNDESVAAKNEDENRADVLAPIPARKKKNKGKKSESTNIAEKTDLDENVMSLENKIKPDAENNKKEIHEIKTIDASLAESKDTTASKKKKKKKNRHDSDKSDVNESCTLAFHKLLESTNVENEEENTSQNPMLVQLEEDDKSVHISSSKESDTDTLENKENLKSKRKHKKNKNVPIEKEKSVEIVTKNTGNINILTPDKIESEDVLLNLKENVATTEFSPKPKAKIAKPVQKRKGKSDLDNLLDSTDNKDDTTSNICTSKDSKENLDELDKSSQKSDGKNKNIDDNTKISIVEPQMIHLSEKEQVIDVEKNVNIDDERLKLDTSDDNSGFIEVKAGKNKKKQTQTDKRQTSTTVLSDTVEHSKKDVLSHEPDKSDLLSDIPHIDIKENVKPEDLEGLKVATPDLIQYPRSTSQLNIDSNNNNTVIQEITVSDEMKLGIPVYVSTPIVEGSGETPEVKITEEPIKLSECKPKIGKNNNEKTDIKSKMFEVNKEMEELRRSIERSLAELTGSEACDSKVDTAFEELFQSQNKEELKLTHTQGECHKDEMNEQHSKQSITPEPKNKDTFKTQDIATAVTSGGNIDETTKKVVTEENDVDNTAPVCPARSKSKGKSKRKGKKEQQANTSNVSTTQGASSSSQASQSEVSKPSDKTKQKTDNNSNSSSEEKGKQQSSDVNSNEKTAKNLSLDLSFEPIENFEDALTSSAEDVNKTFDIIANEATQATGHKQYQNTPQINVIAPSEDGEDEKRKDSKTKSPISQPKNLLGHPNIPVSSNKNDFKKEKNKPPSSIQAKVKIKDSNEIEKAEKHHSPQNKKLIKEANGHDAFSYTLNENDNIVYKYSFRNVFLQSACHVCKKDLIQKVPCKFCSLIFYCSQKHMDDDWPKHQSLCFAVSTISHLKEQKFIYADIRNITGHEYRVLRMQMILSCEKIMKRKLTPWEQEALLYPRVCGDVGCREWKQSKLKDCEGCGQISYCTDHPEHLPAVHKQWCKSYALYQKMVKYQQTQGRVEPKLPTRVLTHYHMPDNLNEILGCMYEEKIDMDDIHYAALTQIATAPLTTAFSYQLYDSKTNSNKTNGLNKKKSTFTIHSLANDVQFEADFLNKWEIFFLHVIDTQNLRVVLIGLDLNPNNLPLDILGKIRLCENCKTNQRRVIIDFHDKQSYEDYYASDDFSPPDIVCAFNPNIQRTSTYKIEDIWPITLKFIFKQRVPFLLTSYTLDELKRDIDRIEECSKIDFKIISDPKLNPFSSVRPDRNFITDHEMPLLFKNYCYSIMCGV